jgi:hypothetical protein
MVRILSHITRFLSLNKGTSPASNVAGQLMERAQVRAGRHPHQAEELREAARAYLSVVR